MDIIDLRGLCNEMSSLTRMNALIQLAYELDDKRHKLEEEYRHKAEKLCIFDSLVDEVMALIQNTESLHRYQEVYEAYQKQREGIVKTVLLEKLQQMYKEVLALQTNIAKTLQYVDPKAVDIETMIRDLDKLRFLKLHIAGSLKVQLRASLEKILEIHKLTLHDEILGLQSGTMAEEVHDASFLHMTNDEIEKYNADIKDKSEAISRQFSEEQKKQRHLQRHL